MTTITSISLAMFSVASQDRAVAHYTGKLGWEVVSDVGWGGEGQVPRMFSVTDSDGNWIWVVQSS